MPGLSTGQTLLLLVAVAALLAVVALLLLLVPTRDPRFDADVEQACALTRPEVAPDGRG